MRILAVTDFYRDDHENGSEVFCAELINALRDVHEIDVLARASPPAGWRRNVPRWIVEDRVANDLDRLAAFLWDLVGHLHFDLVYNIGGLLFGCRVSQLLSALRPDVALVNHFQALLGPYAEAEGRSAADSTAHDVDQMVAAARARVNIFVSAAEHRAASMNWTGFDPATASIVPNGLLFGDAEATRADRSLYSHGREPAFVIVTAGRFSDKVKGADLIYRAFAQLAAENPDVFLLSIGNSERFSSVLRDVPPDRFRLVKWLPRPQFLQTLAGADLVVVPSRHEPFGLIAIEALSLGVPVLANAVGGLAEIVHHHEFGALNPLGDGSYGLYTAMRLLVSNPERLREMGRAGQRYVRSHYAIGRVARLVDADLRRAAAGALVHHDVAR